MAFLSSNIVQKTGQLFLLAGLTWLGTAGDVYRFGLFISIFNLIVPILTLNVHMSAGRILFEIREPARRADFIVSIWLAGSASVFFGGAIIAGILYALGLSDPLTLGSVGWYAAILATLAIFVTSQCWTVLVRIDDRARPFMIFGALVGAGSLVIFAGSYLLGVPPFTAGLLGFSGGQLIASSFAIWTCRESLVGGRPSLTNFRMAILYSSGTVIFAAAQWSTNYLGRWLAAPWLGAGELATYTLLTQFLIALTMTLTTLYEAKRVLVIRKFASGEFGDGVAQINASFKPSLIIILLFFGALFLGFPIVRAVLPTRYPLELSWCFTAMIQCIAYSISIRTYWIAIGLRKTNTFGLAAILGAILNILSMLLLAPLHGINGLLIAGALGLLLQSVIAHFMLKPSLKSEVEPTGNGGAPQPSQRRGD